MDTYYIFAGRGAGSVFLAEHDLVTEHTAARWLAKRCDVATGHGCGSWHDTAFVVGDRCGWKPVEVRTNAWGDKSQKE